MIFSGQARLPDKESTPLDQSQPYVIEPLDESNFELLAQYDKDIYPIDRSKLLRKFLNNPPLRTTKLAILNGKCRGYLCVRKTGDKYITICPLLADTRDIADILLAETIREQNIQGQFIDIFIPQANFEQTRDVVNKYGISELGAIETVMCTDPEAANEMTIPWQKVYGQLFNTITMYWTDQVKISYGRTVANINMCNYRKCNKVCKWIY